MHRGKITFLFALLCALLARRAEAHRGDEATSQRRSEAPAAIRRLTIVGINDVHGALLAAPAQRSPARFTSREVGGAEWFGGWLAAVREDARENGGEVLVLDAGDEFQGSLISNAFRGESVVEAMNALGLDAAALGNHEFDFGLPALDERIAQARYPFLAANVFLERAEDAGPSTARTPGSEERRPRWIRPTALLDVRGVRVGLIGLATVETPLVTNPRHVAGLRFLPGGPIAAQLAGDLRAQGATVVIVIAHAGPRGPEHEIARIAEACAGKVDAIVSGHHHVALGPPPLVVAGIPIVQSGSKLTHFSLIELDLDERGAARNFVVNRGTFPSESGPQPIFHEFQGAPPLWRGKRVQPDAAVAALVQRYDARVKALREKRIGFTEVPLHKGRSSARAPDQIEDDLLGNLAADALRFGAGSDDPPADFALQNAGGLRVSEVVQGPITYGQIFDLNPFDDERVLLSLGAAELRDALEAVLRHGKGPLRVSGLRYTIDARRASKKTAKSAPRGALVTEVRDDRSDEILCKTSACSETSCAAPCVPGTFTVAVSDFLAQGGDGVLVPDSTRRRRTSRLVRDVLVDFVRAHDPLTARLLGAGKRRILEEKQPAAAARARAEPEAR